jgi:hypothetical protein
MGGERFKSLSVSEAVYNKLREIAARRGFSTLADTVAYLATLEELVLRRLESITASTGNDTTTSGNITTTTGNVATGSGNHPAATDTAVKPPSKAKTSGKLTAWDILKRDKVSCMSNIKARNPSRVIESLFEAGAVKIDLGHDVCVVYPEFWWRFWDTLDKLKTPNDEENVKEFKDERMKWLYTVLRREGIVVLDSTRKPPVWTFNKQVEIPEKAFEVEEGGGTSGGDKASQGEAEENYEPVELYR